MKSPAFFSFVFLALGITVTSPTFPKQHGIFSPSAKGNKPIEITLDFADGKEAFSPYLFMVRDAPEPVAHGYALAKEAHFKVIAMTQSANQAFSLTLAQEKAGLLFAYGFEGVLFFPASAVQTQEAIEKSIDEVIGEIDELKKTYPSLRINAFLFGYEPDVAGNIFWEGTKEQFFRNYAVFARYLKSKNRKYLVGGAGFSSSSGDWPKDFIRYMSDQKVPLDVVSFHAYSFEVEKGFLDAIDSLRKLLIQFPVTECFFDRPKIAITEWNIKAASDGNSIVYDERIPSWRAAHNTLALSAMAEQGLWMSCEYFDNSFWTKGEGIPPLDYYARKAFNALADTIRIAQRGSDFRTLGVSAGRSKDKNALVIVVSNFDPNGYGANFMSAYEHLPGVSPLFDQIQDLRHYQSYKIRIKNLPWGQGDDLVLERYCVDERAAFELQEISEYKGNAELFITRDIGMPQVQLIKLYRKN